jgi:hypothetical protein
MLTFNPGRKTNAATIDATNQYTIHVFVPLVHESRGG